MCVCVGRARYRKNENNDCSTIAVKSELSAVRLRGLKINPRACKLLRKGTFERLFEKKKKNSKLSCTTCTPPSSRQHKITAASHRGRVHSCCCRGKICRGMRMVGVVVVDRSVKASRRRRRRAAASSSSLRTPNDDGGQQRWPAAAAAARTRESAARACGGAQLRPPGCSCTQ